VRKSRRDRYLGVYVTERIKREISRRASKLGVSVSLLVNDYLADRLGLPRPELIQDGRRRSGRRLAPRAVLTNEFRTAVLSANGRDGIIKRLRLPNPETFYILMRDGEIPLTKTNERRLQNLAKTVGYEGVLFMELST